MNNAAFTLHDAIMHWIDTYKRTSLKRATYDRMLTSVKLMDKYPISEIEPHKLTGMDIQRYINALLDAGYARTTIKKQFNLISAYVRYANAEGTILRPLYNAVEIPSQAIVKKPKRQIEAYSEYEQTKLKEVLDTRDKPGYVVISFILLTGLRVGEALALKWTDVSWQKRAITVNKTLINGHNTKIAAVQNSAKSNASNRTIPLSTEAARLLNSLPKSGQFIFGDERPFSYEALRWHTKHACETASVPYRGLHVFRHTFATNCYYKGCDVKILSKLLGHGSVSVTYNTYIHLYGDALEEMRAVLD